MKSSRSAFMLVFDRESVSNINTVHVSTYFLDLKVKITPGRSKFQSLWQMLLPRMEQKLLLSCKYKEWTDKTPLTVHQCR